MDQRVVLFSTFGLGAKVDLVANRKHERADEMKAPSKLLVALSSSNVWIARFLAISNIYFGGSVHVQS